MATLFGDVYESKFILVKIGRQILYVNLIAIEISDYDAILGVDWLSIHHTMIDY